MASKILTRAVTSPDDGETWDFNCPDCGFASPRWTTKKAAMARGDQHFTEHETGEPMPELADFNTQEG